MNRRTKCNIAVLVWLAGLFLVGFGVWNFQGGQLMILIYLVAGMIIYMLYAFMVRCPKCRYPILLRPHRIFGMEIYTWSIAVPVNCRHCGLLLP